MVLRDLPQFPFRELRGIVFDLERRPSGQRHHTDHPGMPGEGFGRLFEIFVWLHGFSLRRPGFHQDRFTNGSRLYGPLARIARILKILKALNSFQNNVGWADGFFSGAGAGCTFGVSDFTGAGRGAGETSGIGTWAGISGCRVSLATNSPASIFFAASITFKSAPTISGFLANNAFAASIGPRVSRDSNSDSVTPRAFANFGNVSFAGFRLPPSMSLKCARLLNPTACESARCVIPFASRKERIYWPNVSLMPDTLYFAESASKNNFEALGRSPYGF